MRTQIDDRKQMLYQVQKIADKKGGWIGKIKMSHPDISFTRLETNFIIASKKVQKLLAHWMS